MIGDIGSRRSVYPSGSTSKTNAVSNSLSRLLEPYGAPEQVVDLRQETPDAVPYVDLLEEGDRRALPDGVVESRTEPLAYVVDGVRRSCEVDLPSLRKTVALRGDAPYLVVVEPGRILVYDAALTLQKKVPPLEDVSQSDDQARMVFPRLNAALSCPEKAGRVVHKLLFDLLDKAILDLERTVDRDDAISLAGRALFMRFLIDRGIVTPEHTSKICPTARDLFDLFTGPQRTLATCRWLNETFNGDFLPLSFLEAPSRAKSIRPDAFAPLEDVMQGSPGGQRRFDWASIDFAHVPVGLLSQVWERQAAMWDPAGQRREGAYYTPRRIADFMVKEVFAGLKDQGPVPPHTARVLDASAGGGVFLVSVFQEIVAAWWRHHGRPPETGEIRSILYGQLTGFDISEPALQLAALSLYLKAIELDRDPHPPAKLRFRALRGRVLHSMREPGEETAEMVLGSLGPRGNGLHRHRYDLVIGNPPWTGLERKWGHVHDRMVEAVRPMVAERLGQGRAAAFTIPDRVPDLSFAWRALEWAKPSAWIALALHGRLLFKTSEGGREAREDLFRAIQVTGLLNGADLRKTQVWPGVDTPFCLLFARNRPAAPDHAFHFVSPYLEERLNQQGRLRIDSTASYPVELRRLLARPELLKVLFRGNAMDVALLDKVRGKDWPTLRDYFDQSQLKTGQGYQIATQERKVPEDLLKKRLPELTAGWEGSIRIDPDRLPRFDKKRLQWPRSPDIYRGPLVLVRESLAPRREEGRALCCFSDLVYSRSFYGYSAWGHLESETLIRYLVLLLHSDFFCWHALVTSSKFGVERDTILKDDVDSFPLRPLEDLPQALAEEIGPLAKALFAGRDDVWADLDAWTARVYGLNRWDQEVIRDTLAVAQPFPEAQKKAQRPPETAEIASFTARLERELRPFAQTAGKSLRVRRLREASTAAPWEVLLLETRTQQELPEPRVLEELFQRADREGASQILLVQPQQGRLLLGILRQYRYWTPTRARLAALEILEEHLGAILESA
jgi:hypothetical protein